MYPCEQRSRHSNFTTNLEKPIKAWESMASFWSGTQLVPRKGGHQLGWKTYLVWLSLINRTKLTSKSFKLKDYDGLFMICALYDTFCSVNPGSIPASTNSSASWKIQFSIKGTRFCWKKRVALPLKTRHNTIVDWTWCMFVHHDQFSTVIPTSVHLSFSTLKKIWKWRNPFFKLRLLPQRLDHLAIVVKVEQLSLVETESVNLEH